MWPIIRSTPDARPGQPQTKKRQCGIQPAHESLFTDVFGSRLSSAPSICTTTSRTVSVGGRTTSRFRLDGLRDAQAPLGGTDVFSCPSPPAQELLPPLAPSLDNCVPACGPELWGEAAPGGARIGIAGVPRHQAQLLFSSLRPMRSMKWWR